MKIDDIPNKRAKRYQTRVSVAVSHETKNKLKFLRDKREKDISELLRILINDIIKDVVLDETA